MKPHPHQLVTAPLDYLEDWMLTSRFKLFHRVELTQLQI